MIYVGLLTLTSPESTVGIMTTLVFTIRSQSPVDGKISVPVIHIMLMIEAQHMDE